MAVRDRIKKYRETGGAAGLVRVEVLVPPDARERVLEHARLIREAYRGDDVLSDRLKGLFDEAVGRFGPQCLWNVNPSRNLHGMKLIAQKLRDHGNMNAWRLSEQILEEIDSATR
jgi:hypothetical protein